MTNVSNWGVSEVAKHYIIIGLKDAVKIVNKSFRLTVYVCTYCLVLGVIVWFEIMGLDEVRMEHPIAIYTYALGIVYASMCIVTYCTCTSIMLVVYARVLVSEGNYLLNMVTTLHDKVLVQRLERDELNATVISGVQAIGARYNDAILAHHYTSMITQFCLFIGLNSCITMTFEMVVQLKLSQLSLFNFIYFYVNDLPFLITFGYSLYTFSRLHFLYDKMKNRLGVLLSLVR